MGGFMGIGGSGAKADRSWQSLSAGGLNSIFNWALPSAQSSIGAGMGNLQKAGSFWQTLMSGNRSAVNQAVAPQVNAANTQADAQKRQLAASGTARGGGVACQQQQTDTNKLAQIQNLLFGARTTGASELGKIGAQEGAIGANLAADAGNAATNLGALGTNARGQDLQQQNALGQGAGELIAGLLLA